MSALVFVFFMPMGLLSVAVAIVQAPQVARVIYALTAETSSYVNGAEIHINGGQHV